MESTKNLEEGMLIALIGLSDTGDLSTTFLEVFQRQSTGSMSRRTGDHSRGSFTTSDSIRTLLIQQTAAVILNLAEPGDTDTSRRLLYYKGSILKGRFSLAEIPGTLYPSFSHTLRRLQDQFISDEDFAFQSLVVCSELLGSCPHICKNPCFRCTALRTVHNSHSMDCRENADHFRIKRPLLRPRLSPPFLRLRTPKMRISTIDWTVSIWKIKRP